MASLTVVVIAAVLMSASRMVHCSGGLLALEMTCTGCEHTCTTGHYSDSATCPSTILVNGVESSLKKDGFNIVVVDTSTEYRPTNINEEVNQCTEQKKIIGRKKKS